MRKHDFWNGLKAELSIFANVSSIILNLMSSVPLIHHPISGWIKSSPAHYISHETSCFCCEMCHIRAVKLCPQAGAAERERQERERQASAAPAPGPPPAPGPASAPPPPPGPPPPSRTTASPQHHHPPSGGGPTGPSAPILRRREEEEERREVMDVWPPALAGS